VQYSTYPDNDIKYIQHITFSQLPARISQAFALDPDLDYDNTELSSKVAESRLGRVPRVPSSSWQDFDSWIQLMDESRCSKIGKRMKYDGSIWKYEHVTCWKPFKTRLAKFNGGACKHSKTIAKHHKTT